MTVGARKKVWKLQVVLKKHQKRARYKVRNGQYMVQANYEQWNDRTQRNVWFHEVNQYDRTHA
jgi:hypothetical protein